MRKEKYIEERYSESTSNEKKTLLAFVINMPLPNGDKFYQRFRIKDYVSQGAAFKDAVRVRNRQIEQIRLAEKGIVSFDDYTVQELFDLIPANFDRRLSTYDNYKSIYGKYIKEQFGSKNIKDITEEDILSTLKRCAQICISHQVTKLKSIWRKLFIIAQRKRVIQMNLVDLVESPKSDNYTERSVSEQNITQEDFLAFCDAMSEYGHYLPNEVKNIYNRNIMLYMLKLMRITGIRSQEARAIRRNNIVFSNIERESENGTVTKTEVAYLCIRRSIGSSRVEYNVEVATKSKQSIRDIPITGDGIVLVKEILQYSKNDLLFADYYGNPFSTDDLCDYLYRVSNTCGIKVYPLLMRKSFSADLYAQGVNPAVTKKLMGHKKEDMSLNAYASASKEQLIDTTQERKYKKQEL